MKKTTSSPKRNNALSAAVLLAGCCALLCAGAQAMPLSAYDIIQANPGATDGIYTIDPDGQGGFNPFEVYADMTSFGGGWTLGVNSLRNNRADSADMTANTGVVGLQTAHTRNLTNLAILGEAQIRHQIIQNNQVVFDGYYTGNYHGVLSADEADWTVAVGNIYQPFGSHVLGNDWSTAQNDVDDYHWGNCADIYGAWYHGSCWSSHPASQNHSGPYASSFGYVDAWRVWVRGDAHGAQVATSVPEPGTLALLLAGLAGMRARRR